ncbi:MAG: AAA family ATPase [Erythrobacter sp.]|nr:AAA family ATPase [Erythrobacter sp.]
MPNRNLQKSLIPTESVEQKAAKPSIIESFSIHGLYGYRDASISMTNAASVFISQNGTGKTTLIAALNAILSRQFGKLRSLKFRQIFLKLKGFPEIFISKDDIDIAFKQPISSGVINISSKMQVSAASLHRYLADKFAPEQSVRDYYSTRTTLDQIVSAFEYNSEKAFDFCRKQQRALYDASPPLSHAYDTISASISSYEIVYLPTYRRIELVLDRDQNSPFQPKREPDLEYAPESLYSGVMQFGLSDISETLKRLNNQLTQQSDTGYRKISVNIINDLVDNKLSNTTKQDLSIPARDELEVFFSRVGKPTTFGPSMPIEFPDLDKIYNRPLDDSAESSFLVYFLSKLDSVIDDTKRIEAPIREFIKTCNRYLGSETADDEEFWVKRYYNAPVDPKEIVLDRSSLSISVRSVDRDIDIPLDSLSSGEKQMVSLFAKMYLSPREKIVLIDEPELSLSIGWQTLILPDIFSSTTCQQMIAITHSPFIFENFLEGYAKAITLEQSNEPNLLSDFENLDDA